MREDCEGEGLHDPDLRECPECGEIFPVIDGKDWEIYAAHLEGHLRSDEQHKDWRCGNCGSRPRAKYQDEPEYECRHCGFTEWYVHTEAGVQ